MAPQVPRRGPPASRGRRGGGRTGGAGARRAARGGGGRPLGRRLGGKPGAGGAGQGQGPGGSQTISNVRLLRAEELAGAGGGPNAGSDREPGVLGPVARGGLGQEGAGTASAGHGVKIF